MINPLGTASLSLSKDWLCVYAMHIQVAFVVAGTTWICYLLRAQYLRDMNLYLNLYICVDCLAPFPINAHHFLIKAHHVPIKAHPPPQVKKIKSIYHTMNMFNLDVTQRCLIAECWCPVEDLDEIQRALTRGTVSLTTLTTLTPSPPSHMLTP